MDLVLFFFLGGGGGGGGGLISGGFETAVDFTGYCCKDRGK